MADMEWFWEYMKVCAGNIHGGAKAQNLNQVLAAVEAAQSALNAFCRNWEPEAPAPEVPDPDNSEPGEIGNE